MDRNKYLYVYSNIFFTKGYTRTMVYDCCTQRTLFFENAFYALLDEFRKHKIDSIINKYANVDVLGFAEFLVSNNFASLVNDISLFPTLKKVWFSPNEMENAIIDIDSTSNHNYKKISEELQALHCAHLEIRIFYDADIQKLSNIARHFYKADFKSVDIIVKYKEGINPPDYLQLAAQYPPLSIFVYEAPSDTYHKSLIDTTYHGIGFVCYLKQKIEATTDCGIINRSSFSLPSSISNFTEGILKNKCLNRKLSITVDGQIKNCPCMSKAYGNIRDHSIAEIFRSNEFQKYWDITKDEIRVCKDCEYRYICNDCRAFVTDIYDKPLKCKYNPYKQKWEE
ncbi:grasp-with-spasm system SPASM domain peptide maturase [Prevotella copri]|uniref:Grasp-with-spasm system SPASM domain peptide maturase n=1 Tax=Segatella copri TaxID=165179 RepID=A0AAW5IUE6_9BACT|nr:grasp-with-spasm system SPASM domain peptide maturase [Segatella copri]MCP9553854.1 grasp-with-spasm system SPASM domain peptide maturase [Segatella copri]MCP9574602.1 grasp-with-spasm system SPASM domain peptide maturase [Segatella copri]MCP9577590.1 grasp-with-spasm system SPASM domain peptide maturase [Segatella copri]MCP9580486.1 grasp-with-spasm system SPASM domain peptide maturase [Segatella copri]MCP9583412.1 grasp-with-spasm system SPASM domain peptide maturase [Segatella copri]